jgi:hypothetical protein
MPTALFHIEMYPHTHQEDASLHWYRSAVDLASSARCEGDTTERAAVDR